MMFTCKFCACLPFDTATSLIDHVMLCHVSKYESDAVTANAKYFDDEQWEFIIKLQLMLREVFPNLKIIYVELVKYFPDRSYEAIRALSKLKVYKSKFQELQVYRASDYNEEMDGEDTTANTTKTDMLMLKNEVENKSPSSRIGSSTDEGIPDLTDYFINVDELDINIILIPDTSPNRIDKQDAQTTRSNIDNDLLQSSIMQLSDRLESSNIKFLSKAADRFKCIFYGRVFSSKSGLLEHKRHKHTTEYVMQIHRGIDPSRNTIWTDEEIYLLAELEKDLVKGSDQPIRNINQHLS